MELNRGVYCPIQDPHHVRVCTHVAEAEKVRTLNKGLLSADTRDKKLTDLEAKVQKTLAA